MKAWMLTLALAGVLALSTYLPVYYHSSQFDAYVKDQTHSGLAQEALEQAIFAKAHDMHFSVMPPDVHITADDLVFHVAVRYQVPANFYVFQHELAFQAVAARHIPASENGGKTK